MLLVHALIDLIEMSTLFPKVKHSFKMMENRGTPTKHIQNASTYRQGTRAVSASTCSDHHNLISVGLVDYIRSTCNLTTS